MKEDEKITRVERRWETQRKLKEVGQTIERNQSEEKTQNVLLAARNLEARRKESARPPEGICAPAARNLKSPVDSNQINEAETQASDSKDFIALDFETNGFKHDQPL